MSTSYPRGSSKLIRYHGREGRPVVHQDEKTGRLYIMVRKKGGGTKRLYEGSSYRVEKKGGPTRILRV